MTALRLTHVAEGTYASLGKLGSNNGVIVTSAGTIVVDVPHTPSDAVSLVEALVGYGVVCYLVHTDHHIDHTLTNGFFEGTVVSHELTRQHLLTGMPSPIFVEQLLTTLDPNGRHLMTDHPERLPTVTFSDRMEIVLGDTTAQLIHLPGHTPNTIGVYLPERGVLFCGDTVCEMGLPSFQESSFRSWRASIDVVLSLDFDILVPGHGVVGDRSTAERFREQIDELVDRVEEARLDGVSAEEASERIRFQDMIHVTTDSYVGYPASMIEEFQRRSIRAIYSELETEAMVTLPPTTTTSASLLKESRNRK